MLSQNDWSPSTVRAFARKLLHETKQFIQSVDSSSPCDSESTMQIIHSFCKLQNVVEDLSDCVQAIEDTLYLSDADIE